MTQRMSGWKCINWHNLRSQRHKLHGSDIFSEGRSESGKTTFLDSLQYVLTGGYNMQWNSAANPTLSATQLRAEGRNLRSILLRMQDNEPLHKEGANIAYFAVEFADGEGKKTTIGVGAKIPSPTATAITRWWYVFHHRGLDDVVFSDGAGHALDREDFRAENPSHEIHVYDSRYQVALMHFFYPNLGDRNEAEAIEALNRWTKYLNLAKAYGRLKAADVSDLIRKALPAPRLEAFAAARSGFDEIRTIRREMKKAEERLEKMLSLQGEVAKAVHNHNGILLSDYRRTILDHDKLVGEQKGLEGRVEGETTNLATARKAEEAALHSIASLKARLEAIHDTDAQSILNRLQENADALQRAHQALADAQSELERGEAALEEHGDLLKAAEAAFEQAKESLIDALTTISNRLTGEQRQCIQDAAKCIQKDALEDMAPTLKRFRKMVLDAMGDLREQETLHKAAARKAMEDVHALEEARSSVVAQIDVAPLPGVAELSADLQGQVVPVYQGIEILLGREADGVLLQEFLPREALAALVPRPGSELEAIRRHVVSRHPNLLVVDTERLAEPAVLQGILSCVDAQASDPYCLAYLEVNYGDVALLDTQAQRGDRERVVWRDRRVYDGKAWHMDAEAELTFLGKKAREAAKKRRLEALGADIEAAQTREKEANREARRVARHRETLRGALEDAEEAWQDADLRGHVDQKSRMKRDVELAQKEVERAQRAHGAAKSSVELLENTKQALEQMAEEKGVHELARQQNELAEQMRKQRAIEQKAHVGAAIASDRIGSANKALQALRPLVQSAYDKRVAAREVVILQVGISPAALDELQSQEDVFRMDHDQLGNRDQTLSGRRAQAAQEAERIVMDLHHEGEDLHFDVTTFTVVSPATDEDLAHRIEALQKARAEKNRQQVARIQKIHDEQSLLPVARMLKEELSNMEVLVDGINQALLEIPFQGRPYRLHRGKSEDIDERLLRLIDDFTIDNQEPLKAYLERLVQEDYDAERLQQIFDYRRWFNFSLRRRNVASNDYSEASTASSSGGAQAAPHYAAMYAMLAMFYKDTQTRLPIVFLDEAFRGVDIANKMSLYEMAKRLGLIVVVASTEFEGHSTLPVTTDIFTFTKDLETNNAFIERYTQDFHGHKRLVSV